MNATQITHHDLDGYGASTVVASYLPLSTIVHVPRYADVGPVVESELKRLGSATDPELLLITDLGLEDVTIKFIRSFTALNRRRHPAAQHRLIVLDHHASSLDRLVAHDLAPSSEDGATKTFNLGDPNIVVLIDVSRCATRIAYEHRALYATREGRGRDTCSVVRSWSASMTQDRRGTPGQTQRAERCSTHFGN
ncbi:hypothetical protein JNW90_24745 [Micromonospora sp. STR1s_5]|nr:hypothetical protein [Micromonospora sp. STR1s_5]